MKLKTPAEIAEALMLLLERECHVCGSSRKMAVEYIAQAIAAERKLLAEAVAMAEFYGDKQTVNEMCNGTGDDFYEEGGRFHGGKRAREFLNKVRG